ncbi:Lsr2 family protein, partial [Kineococcus glutinatus]|uniref:histone-like nucleoid-structuring protein Lsr2 n=1 Tax=Kineococcus glutinatus TaxID=1070872 RepID=UPI0031F15F46
MAQKVQVLLVDDVDGGEAAETVSFALDGVSYEIDLSDEHAGALRDAFAPWIGHARRVGGRTGARRAAA